MQRFNFINSLKNQDEKFIDMNKFWDSIKKSNSTNSQNLFSPFSDKLDLFYICLLVGLKQNYKQDTSRHELGDIYDKWSTKLKNSKASDYIIGLYLNTITDKDKEDKTTQISFSQAVRIIELFWRTKDVTTIVHNINKLY